MSTAGTFRVRVHVITLAISELVRDCYASRKLVNYSKELGKDCLNIVIDLGVSVSNELDLRTSCRMQ
jgi:biotin synthase-related radical SAM superfamily protein